MGDKDFQDYVTRLPQFSEETQYEI